jgi:hypothetical protein
MPFFSILKFKQAKTSTTSFSKVDYLGAKWTYETVSFFVQNVPMLKFREQKTYCEQYC